MNISNSFYLIKRNQDNNIEKKIEIKVAKEKKSYIKLLAQMTKHWISNSKTPDLNTE
jgi:hypothetical protein